MELPETFPKTLPIHLYKHTERHPKPVKVATLMVPPTRVLQDRVIYSMNERRFSLSVGVTINGSGDPGRLNHDDVIFDLNVNETDAVGLMLKVPELKRFLKGPSYWAELIS